MLQNFVGMMKIYQKASTSFFSLPRHTDETSLMYWPHSILISAWTPFLAFPSPGRQESALLISGQRTHLLIIPLYNYTFSLYNRVRNPIF
ncbi:hypothetical protein L1887_11382 [Cichorium endivia]|nr:hypothetical protein L1887_11382 [Cichorium endivia]